MLRLGTSSWTAQGWERAFYPPETPQRDYLRHYATKFDTVEIDATFYAIPSRTTVDGWRTKTPPNFTFAAKVPKVITHEKMLVDCERELGVFIEVMSRLGTKLGPLLFQFRYFRKGELELSEFLDRLCPVLDHVPEGVRVAVEVRNKKWLAPELLTALSERNMALALVDHPYMPYASEYLERGKELITADFTFIRLIGHRQKTEQKLADELGEVSFERSVIDRSRELASWSELIRSLDHDRFALFAYVNNHYSGFAPDDIRRLMDLVKSSE